MSKRKRIYRGATRKYAQSDDMSRVNTGVFIVAGLIFGLLLTLGYSQIFSGNNSSPEQKMAMSKNQAVEPVFDFYTMLPESEIKLTTLTGSKGNQTQSSDKKEKSSSNSQQVIVDNPTVFDVSSKLQISGVSSSKIEELGHNKKADFPTGERLVADDSIRPSNSSNIAENKSLAASAITTERHYLLRAGSFKSSNDARKLLAQLLLLGLKPHIEEVEIKDSYWFRVQIGPFQEKDQAQKLAKVLADNHLESLIVRR